MHTRTLLLLVILLAGFATQALAQITITEADIRAQLSKTVTTTYYEAETLTGLQSIANQTGGNLTFDFRTATYGAGEPFSSEVADCSGDLPGCDDPDLSVANLMYKQTYGDSIGVSFAMLDSDGFYILGGATRGEYDENHPGDEDVSIKFVPAMLSQKLPTTMGTSWSSESEMKSALFPDFYKIIFKEDHTVDGWGRLITPHGQGDALRIRERSISVFDLGGNFIVGDTTYSIQYLTKSGLSASLYLDGENGNVIAADYTVPGDLGSGIDDEHDVPSSIALDQNFPNPFNPSTTIPFTLQQAGQVSLVIYDLLGREVAQVVNEMRPAGTYQAVWEAGDLPSGTYIYKLSVGGESMTRMLTLLK